MFFLETKVTTALLSGTKNTYDILNWLHGISAHVHVVIHVQLQCLKCGCSLFLWHLSILVANIPFFARTGTRLGSKPLRLQLWLYTPPHQVLQSLHQCFLHTAHADTHSRNGGYLCLGQASPHENSRWSGAVRRRCEGIGSGGRRRRKRRGRGWGGGGERGPRELGGGGEIVHRCCRLFLLVKPCLLILVQLPRVSPEPTHLTIEYPSLGPAGENRLKTSDQWWPKVMTLFPPHKHT